MKDNTYGTLYAVGTPIGNLGDISPRAAETLSNVDIIAAEDTRRTLQLLNYLGIKKPMISYHRHNETVRVDHIIGKLLEGMNIALVSDAGMPGISDPGEPLIAAAAEAGITVTTVPGPAALISALVASGLPTSRFAFDGFLPMNKKNRKARINEIKTEKRTVILYEAPHKLIYTLKDLESAFGAERKISLCRELTKIHEEIIRTTIGEAVIMYDETPPKGEFVLVIHGCEEIEQEETTIDEDFLYDKYLDCVNEGMTTKEAVKAVASEYGIQSRELYNIVISRKE